MPVILSAQYIKSVLFEEVFIVRLVRTGLCRWARYVVSTVHFESQLSCGLIMSTVQRPP